jgi:hypothetical protein
MLQTLHEQQNLVTVMQSDYKLDGFKNNDVGHLSRWKLYSGGYQYLTLPVST